MFACQKRKVDMTTKWPNLDIKRVSLSSLLLLLMNASGSTHSITPSDGLHGYWKHTAFQLHAWRIWKPILDTDDEIKKAVLCIWCILPFACGHHHHPHHHQYHRPQDHHNHISITNANNGTTSHHRLYYSFPHIFSLIYAARRTVFYNKG